MSVQRINAEPDSLKDYLRKIWGNKSLILAIARRDLKAKYAQTAIGLAWTFIQPIFAVIVYTLFFSGLMDFKTEYPYILFVLSGILIWNLFNYIFSQGSNSLGQNQSIIKKIAFPKVLLPFTKVIIGLIEFAITSIMLIFLMFFLKVEPRFSMILTPFCLIPLIFFASGLALLLSALTLKKRDLFHIIPFLVNFGIWLTPVFYPVSLIPEKYTNLIYINPVASILQLFRFCLFGEPLNAFILIGLLLSFLTFIIGFIFFKQNEDKIIDVI